MQISNYDLKRLEMYSNNLVDYHLVVDLMPALARMYFLHEMGDTHLSAVQAVSKKKVTFLSESIKMNCKLELKNQGYHSHYVFNFLWIYTKPS